MKDNRVDVYPTDLRGCIKKGKEKDERKFVCDAICKMLTGRTIQSIEDLFKVIIQLMKYVEKFTFLSGEDKRDVVYNNLVGMLYINYNMNDASRYVCLIKPYIESIITISNSNMLINKKKGCFPWSRRV